MRGCPWNLSWKLQTEQSNLTRETPRDTASTERFTNHKKTPKGLRKRGEWEKGGGSSVGKRLWKPEFGRRRNKKEGGQNRLKQALSWVGRGIYSGNPVKGWDKAPPIPQLQLRCTPVREPSLLCGVLPPGSGTLLTEGQACIAAHARHSWALTWWKSRLMVHAVLSQAPSPPDRDMPIS